MSITALTGACFDGKEALANFKFFSVQFLGLGFPHKISLFENLKRHKTDMCWHFSHVVSCMLTEMT